MYQWIPFRLQRKSPKFPVVMENDLRYMLQCIKRTTNWANSRAQISSDGHDRMGRKIQLPPPPPRKKSLGFPTKSEKIPGPKNDITRCTLFADLHARDTQSLPRNFRLCWIPEKSLLKSSSPPPSPRPDKEKCAICLPQIIQRSKISNQSKFLVHPRLLKSGVPPPSWDRNTPTWIQYCLLHNVLYFHIFFVLSI